MLLALESLMAAPAALLAACWPLTTAWVCAFASWFLPRPKGCLIQSIAVLDPRTTKPSTMAAPVIFRAVRVGDG